MAELTQTEIDALVATLKKYPYLCSAGSDDLSPLEGAPQIDDDIGTTDVPLYETMGNVEASILSRNNVKLTIVTRNVDKAMSLISAIKKGVNLLASARKVSVTLVPITSETNQKTITFGNAYLQAGLKMNPGEDGNPTSVQLVYLCKPVVSDGSPFTYA